MSRSPAAIVLGINELIALVFTHLDDRSLFRAACVARHWTDLALDQLWRNVNDLLALFSILGPLSPSSRPDKSATSSRSFDVRYKFKRSLLPSDWDKFQRYSCRVNKIDFDGRAARLKRRQLDASVFDEIARTCPTSTSAFFPKLHSLSWHPCQPDLQNASVVLMHSKVKHLDIWLYKSDTHPLAAFVDQVKSHMPHLLRLDLRFFIPVREIQDEVTSLILGLRMLQEYTAPIYSITTRIAEALGTLPDLRVVAFRKPMESGNGDRADIEHFSPVIPAGAFAAMERACLSAHLPNATNALYARKFMPQNLVYIKVHALDVVPPWEVERFFCGIRDKCPALTELYLDYMITPDSPLNPTAPPLAQRPALDTFRPLFACRQMRKFEFRWDYPLNLADRDMHEFATNLPLLEHFYLNCEAVMEHTRPQLTLHALLPFARFCPHLRCLGLYLDATAAHLHPAPPDAVAFPALTELRVGVSNIQSIEPVALFLSQLCMLGCEVVPGLRWPDAFGIALDSAGILDERRSCMTEYWVLWGEVAKVLPMVTKARLEERARMAPLQQQLMRLTLTSQEERERSDRLEREMAGLRNLAR